MFWHETNKQTFKKQIQKECDKSLELDIIDQKMFFKNIIADGHN